MNALLPWLWIILLAGLPIVLLLSIIVNLLLIPFRRRQYKRRLAFAALSFVVFILFSMVVRAAFRAFYIPSPIMVETLRIGDRILANKFAYRFSSPGRGDIVIFQPTARATDRTNSLWLQRVIGVPGDRIAVRSNHLYLDGVIQSEPYVSLLKRGTDQAGETHVFTNRYDYSFPDPDFMDVKPGQNAYVYPSGPDAINSQYYHTEPTADTAPRVPSSDDDYLFFVRNDRKEGLEVIVPPGHLFVMGDNRNDAEDSHYWGYLDRKRVHGQAILIFAPGDRMRSLTSPAQ